MPGVVRILTKADIPASGTNVVFGVETLFLGVGDAVLCIGQSVALVLADTFQNALAASRAIVVTYSTPTTPPILTIQDAIAKNSLCVKWRGSLPPEPPPLLPS